jgi:hypothetical protein
MQRGDLCVGAVSGEHFRHHRARFGSRQRLAAMGNALESVEDHGVRTSVASYRSIPERIEAEFQRLCRSVCSNLPPFYKIKGLLPQLKAASRFLPILSGRASL